MRSHLYLFISFRRIYPFVLSHLCRYSPIIWRFSSHPYLCLSSCHICTFGVGVQGKVPATAIHQSQRTHPFLHPYWGKKKSTNIENLLRLQNAKILDLFWIWMKELWCACRTFAKHENCLLHNVCCTIFVAQCANNNLQLHWGSYWGATLATGSNSSTEVHNWTTAQLPTYKVAQLDNCTSTNLQSCTTAQIQICKVAQLHSWTEMMQLPWLMRARREEATLSKYFHSLHF